MFSAIKTLFFWFVILLGFFFMGRISTQSIWFNELLLDSKNSAKVEIKSVITKGKNKLIDFKPKKDIEVEQRIVDNKSTVGDDTLSRP